MKQVNVSTLKASLSKYLRYVRKGEEVWVFDRETAVAKLVGVGAGDVAGVSQLVTSLAALGIVTPPTQKLASDFLTHMPRSLTSVVDALLEDRDDGR